MNATSLADLTTALPSRVLDQHPLVEKAPRIVTFQLHCCVCGVYFDDQTVFLPTTVEAITLPAVDALCGGNVCENETDEVAL